MSIRITDMSDVVNPVVLSAAIPSTDGENYTLLCWVKVKGDGLVDVGSGESQHMFSVQNPAVTHTMDASLFGFTVGNSFATRMYSTGDSAQGIANQSAVDTETWYLLATTFTDPALSDWGTVYTYLQTGTQHGGDGGAIIAPGARGGMTDVSFLPTSALYTSGDMHYAGFTLFDRVLNKTEIEDIALNNNVLTDYDDGNLLGYWQAFDDFSGSGIVPDLSSSGNDITAPSTWNWSNDNPVSLLTVDSTVAKFNGQKYMANAAATGDYYGVRLTESSPTPSDAEIKAGTATGQLEHISGLGVDGAFEADFVTAGTFETNDYYLTLEVDSNFFTDDLRTLTSSGKAEETLTDINGITSPNLTGINWAWFDEETADVLSSPTDSGVGETTDGDGLLEISLTNSSLPLGQKGKLVIDDGQVDPKSSSYLITVS